MRDVGNFSGGQSFVLVGRIGSESVYIMWVVVVVVVSIAARSACSSHSDSLSLMDAHDSGSLDAIAVDGGRVVLLWTSPHSFVAW